MSRLIDADELNKTLGIDSDSCSTCSWGYRGRCSRGCDFEDACCAIEDAPAIDPVKHGHWVWKKPSDDCRCSNCGKIADQKYPYCPWCGARMKGEEDEERLNAIE